MSSKDKVSADKAAGEEEATEEAILDELTTDTSKQEPPLESNLESPTDSLDQLVDESVDEPLGESAAVKQAKGGRALALVAVLLSILALIAVCLVLWNDFSGASSTEDNTNSLSQLDARLQSSRETIVSLQDRLREQSETIGALRSQVAEHESTLTDPAALLGSIPARTSALERGLSALQGVSSGTRDNWLLAEAEYFLQIANSQVQLANNATLAAAALRQADERIADVSSPIYTDVRAAITNELTSLELVNDADVTGMTMTLASLSRVVDSLPVQIIESADDAESEVIDDDLSGVDRAWASVRNAMSGLVKVTKPDEAGSPLLTPDSVTLLRANLSLQLQAARLALLKGERAVFQQSLLDAEDWMMTYFDIRSVQVASALETITELRNSPAMDDLPDISGSLKLLRQQRLLDENQQ